MATPLPDGWTENVDPSSGNTFYHFAATGETTWTRPVAQTSSALPDGWTEHSDPSSGKAYYFNAATGETSWTRPAVDSPLPAGWTEQDDGTGRKFYYNAATGETTWIRPEAKTDEPLPSGWSEVPDPASGKNYFYNATTGETTWTRPVDPGAKGKGKSAPPPKAVGGGKGAATSWRDKQANEPWSPGLVPGSNVMCKLPIPETDDFRRLFHARVGERLGQYLDKEGTVAGWDNVRSMYAVNMLDGSVWYFKPHHLEVRDPKSKQWYPAQEYPVDSRKLAPENPGAKTFEWSAIIDALTMG